MDRGAWWAIQSIGSQSQTQLKPLGMHARPPLGGPTQAALLALSAGLESRYIQSFLGP